jgi:hypothetical protein
MHSEVEKLVERLRNYRPPTVDGYGYPPGQEPREHHTICDEAASLIERLYREREKLHAAIRKEAGGKGKPLFGTAFNHFANLYPETAAAILTLAEQPQ